MALVKCPRCDLNYILDGGTLCTVCRKEVKGEHEAIDTPEMCSECGEHPAVAGSDLCMFCLKEMNRRVATAGSTDDLVVPESTNIEIDSVSTMDEIELDIVDDDMASQFGAEGEFKDDVEDLEENPDVVSKEAMAEAEDQDDDEDSDEE